MQESHRASMSANPYEPKMLDIATARGLLDQARIWIYEAALELEDPEGLALAKKIHAHLYPPAKKVK